MSRFTHHIFVCLNERKPEDPRGSCLACGGEKVLEAFKVAILEKGLKGKMRANKAGCLDACALGASVVVYPEAVWYGKVTPDDVAEITESHLVRGIPVERLRMPAGAPRG